MGVELADEQEGLQKLCREINRSYVFRYYINARTHGACMWGYRGQANKVSSFC